MDKIFIGIFLIAIVPYLGLPRAYDTPIVIGAVVFLLYALYRFVEVNEIKFTLPQDDEDDFLKEEGDSYQNHQEMLVDETQDKEEELSNK